jgi:intraflagellar transport protein 88
LDDVNQAIDALKYFEKKDSSVAVNAAINLTFIYLLASTFYNLTI